MSQFVRRTFFLTPRIDAALESDKGGWAGATSAATFVGATGVLVDASSIIAALGAWIVNRYPLLAVLTIVVDPLGHRPSLRADLAALRPAG